MVKSALTVAEPLIDTSAHPSRDTSIAVPEPDEQRNLRIFQRHTKDKLTQTALAKEFNLAQSTISRIIASFDDTRELAKLHLHNNAMRLAERVIKQANVEESLEVLDRLDVAPKKERGGSAHTGVQVIVNMPGQTVSQPPTIDLSPVPFASDAPHQGAGSH